MPKLIPHDPEPSPFRTPARTPVPSAPEPAPHPPAPVAPARQQATPQAVPGQGTPTTTQAMNTTARVDQAGADPKADPWRGVLKGQTRLKLGDTGAAVAKMQAELSQAGFPAPQSGLLDEATRKAILGFQNHFHIQPTGEMGPQTGNGLEEVVAWKGVESGKNILKPGDIGPSVTMLQRQLLTAGYKVELSGVYDPNTAAVVKELQQSKGWGPDGKVGPLTAGALQELQAEDSTGAQPDSMSHVPTDPTGRAVYQDNKARLQQMKVRLSQGQKYDMDLFLANWDQNETRYDKVAKAANMPSDLVAALHWREASGNFGTYLHQGDPLGRPPTHWPTDVPTFYKWEDAATDALKRQKGVQNMFQVGRDTTDMAALASYSEYYNGLGYHYKDRPSPYVFSGTNQYESGKYVADGHYSPTAKDSQLGTMAMISAIREREAKQHGPAHPGAEPAQGSPISLSMAAHPWLEDKPKSEAEKPTQGQPITDPVAEPTTRLDQAGADPKADPWRGVLKGQTRLKLGDTGAAVAKMQAELSQAGFPALQSGQFDEATRKAILGFQNQYHIQPTGEMGPQTGNGLEEVVAWKGVESGKNILKPGDIGPSVTMLQRQLLAAGYKVELSGVYDPNTAAVVKELQQSKGWGPDGKVGPLTAGALQELQAEDSSGGQPGISLSMAAHPWLEDKPKANPTQLRQSGGKPTTPTGNGPREEPKSEAERYAYYKRAIEGTGGQFDGRPEQRNIVGVRGWMNGAPTENIKDEYNDTLAVLWTDKTGLPHVHKYNSTVEPGAYPQLYNPKGDAHLMDGQYDYVLGEHKGQTALNQGEAVDVWRDRNKDGIRQRSETSESGWFGINVHAGGTSPYVSNYSAGCQVIRGGWEGEPWQDFIHQMKSDPDHRYKYTLIDGDDMPRRPLTEAERQH